MAGPTPDVPNVPGVPPLSGYSAEDADALLTADSPEINTLLSQQWGIYDQGGALALDPDSVNTLDSDSEYRIADYPIESGEFRSYNKVATPRTVRITMSKGGPLADRQAFLKKVSDLRTTLDLYNVITPEETHLNMNFQHDGQSRSADRGAGLITVELGLVEIRATGGVQYSDTVGTVATNQPGGAQPPDADKKSPVVNAPKSPAAARTVSKGSVQSRGPSKAEIARVKKLGFNEQKDGSFVLDLK